MTFGSRLRVKRLNVFHERLSNLKSQVIFNIYWGRVVSFLLTVSFGAEVLVADEDSQGEDLLRLAANLELLK